MVRDKHLQVSESDSKFRVNTVNEKLNWYIDRNLFPYNRLYRIRPRIFNENSNMKERIQRRNVTSRRRGSGTLGLNCVHLV